jgi:predicted nucleotidyltransferase
MIRDRRGSNRLKKQILKVRGRRISLSVLQDALKNHPEVSAAHLFGSAAIGASAVNDLDVLILLHEHADKDDVFIDLSDKLSKALNLPEDRIDLLLFDLQEADHDVLMKAINQGVLLKNSDPAYLGDMIDKLSGYMLENEPMRIRAKSLRKERLEAFCET